MDSSAMELSHLAAIGLLASACAASSVSAGETGQEPLPATVASAAPAVAVAPGIAAAAVAPVAAAVERPGLGSCVRLRRGVEMPQLGLGTFMSKSGHECRSAVVAALQAGYRHIDTAAAYNNEKDVMAGVLEAGLQRSDVFITTKLQAKEHGSEQQVRDAFAASLSRLGTDYVDLFLIHNPRGGRILEVWPVLLQLRDEGLARAVGVSNFGVEHLRGLKEAGLEAPEVNQIELHCWLQQRDVVEHHRRESIATMAYSPLARGGKFGHGKTPLGQLAQELGQTEAAVAIRWSLQCGHVVIPKSKSSERIRENVAAGFDISEAQMRRLAKLDCDWRSIASSKDMFRPWDEVATAIPEGANSRGRSKKGKVAEASQP